MAMNMTPEQLRILTDFMAAAGAAIGGKGSVGDLVGEQVHQINQEQARERQVINAEERQRVKQVSGAKKLAQSLGLVRPKGKDPQGSLGVLKSDAGESATALGPLKAQSPLIDALGGFTPDGERGLTSMAMDKNGNTILKGLFTPEDFGPDSSLNTNDVIQALYGSRMIANEPMEQQLRQLQIKKGEESLLSPNEKLLRELVAAVGLDQNQLVDIGEGVKAPQGKLADVMLDEMRTPAELKVAQALTRGGPLADALREMQASKTAQYAPNVRAGLTAQGQLGVEIGTSEYMSKLEDNLSKDTADQQDYFTAISKTAKPEEKLAATKRRTARRNRFIQNDLAASYRGQKGISFKRIDMGDGTFGYGVFQDGNYTGDVYPAY